MKKSKLVVTALSTLFLFTGTTLTTANQIQTVQAARTQGHVFVRGKKNIRLYKGNGKSSHYFAVPKKKYAYSAKKYLKIGRKKYLAYRIGNQSQWLLAKKARVVKHQNKPEPKPQEPATAYQEAKMKMPDGYTRSELLKAYQGHPSPAFILASMKGMDNNNFSRSQISESKEDDDTIINPAALTLDQSLELSQFSLRLINEARSDLGLRPWTYSLGTQKLADDISNEYTQNNKTIQDGHYVQGIVRACKANGLNLDDNYIEDMAGFYNLNQTMSITEMKKNIYFGLKQMLFGYTGSGEEQRAQQDYYQEWEHAGDLFNTQGSTHDGDYDYFGFSISRNNNIYSLHFINVATFIVDSKKYNTSFKP
ncbi:SEC10/PgrA surface exclusion domain-containing protein [Lactobacillus sp. ESL0791]|uniref:SEC10/PgrA surface exclusion domain-containing protein n=1 Tax=Lactobacillus sp. ESL0791 TaxID=2983234 RepID=UPI0023F6F513|nr:SEC10/PgrA surface exclusion domain-containing protein [Lactobacillus sp. ESL0791]MDF7639342.1 SEC10/PgrA surface exclusion domain-containing protein [Lactobacillus sp. ESL0791]